MKKIQKTITVGNDKIIIKSRPVYRFGNFMGYRTKVNDKEYFHCSLEQQVAIDRAYARYIREER